MRYSHKESSCHVDQLLALGAAKQWDLPSRVLEYGPYLDQIGMLKTSQLGMIHTVSQIHVYLPLADLELVFLSASVSTLRSLITRFDLIPLHSGKPEKLKKLYKPSCPRLYI